MGETDEHVIRLSQPLLMEGPTPYVSPFHRGSSVNKILFLTSLKGRIVLLFVDLLKNQLKRRENFSRCVRVITVLDSVSKGSRD